MKTTVLCKEHADEAASLLAHQFARREPLSRNLMIKEEDIRPFFRVQVEYAAEQGLSIVAIAEEGEDSGHVIGVVTIEDHLQPFVPPSPPDHHGLRIIGAYLDSMSMPNKIIPAKPGELYYVGLAAVAANVVDKGDVLRQLIIAQYQHLQSKGYLRGYAKITNPAIVRNFRQLEKAHGQRTLEEFLADKPKDFVYEGTHPFEDFRGETYLFSWEIR